MFLFLFFFFLTRGVLEIDLTRFNLFNYTMLTFSLELDVLLKKETVPLVYSAMCGLFSLINQEPKQPIFINIPFFPRTLQKWDRLPKEVALKESYTSFKREISKTH